MKRKNLVLPILLLLTSVAVALLGGYIKYGVLKPLGIHRDESIMAMPFVLYSDEGLQFMIEMNREMALQNPAEQEDEVETTVAAVDMPQETSPTELSGEETTVPASEETTIPSMDIATEAPTEMATEPPTEPVIVELDDSWFDDMLVIGDSRIHGMRMYHRFGNAYYFTSIGMNIYNVFVTWSSDRGHYKCNLEETLKTVPFSKVMIGIGLNECNYDHPYIQAGFEKLINLIHQYQPDAKIILTSVMMVTEAYSKRDECYSIENLSAINEIIQSFADDETIFYIDVNEWAVDETGYLRKDRVFDGVHFYGVYYEEWAIWLRQKFGELGIA